MPLSSTTPDRVLSALRSAASSEALVEAEALRRRAAVASSVDEGENGEQRVRGTIRLPSGQDHEAVLTVTRGKVDGSCDCGSRLSPCAHLLALASDWAEGGGANPGTAAWRAGWQALLGALAPPKSRSHAIAGREVLAHWIDVIRGRSGPWGIRICWRVHRTSARGMGRGRLIPPARLRSELARLGNSWDARVTDAALYRGRLKVAEPAAFPLEVWGNRVDPLLRALAQADWVRWEATREPVFVDLRPLVPVIRAEDTGSEVGIALDWQTPPDRERESPAFRVVGSEPPWVESDGMIRPVLGVSDGAALDVLLRRTVSVPEADLPSFLGNTVPALEDRGIPVEFAGGETRKPVITESPDPCLYLSQEGSLLLGELRFRYGDYEIASDNPSAVLAVAAGTHRVFLRRDMEAEFRASAKLRELGFRPTDAGRFEMRGDAALDFLFHRLDTLAAEWAVLGQDRLRKRVYGPGALQLRVRLSADIDWLDLDVEVTAEGGDTIPVEEVLRAFRSGSRYVRLGDGAHALLPEEWLERVGRTLEDLGLEKRRARLGAHLAHVVDEALASASEVRVEHRDVWDRLVQAFRGGSAVRDYPVPTQLQAQLRPYQVIGYRWLRHLGEWGLGGILADDMGLGKTVQALALLVHESQVDARGPNLVVAPTSVVPNWEAEARRFAPGLRVVRYEGLDRRALLGSLAADDLVVTSYAVLRRDGRELADVPWNYVVLDEAQAIKNAATLTARAARRLDARRRLTLTGTPLENHLGELWSQFHFVLPGLLGTERKFSQRFAKPACQADEGARAALRRRIGPFVLRRLKGEVASELPEKVDTTLLCEMGPEQERLYRSLLAASKDRVFREVATKGLARSRVSILDALLRLRQACCHPAVLPGDLGRDVPSAKYDLFCDFVSEVVEEGHRVLVFSQFVKVLEILRRWFEEAGIPHLYLDGRTRDREQRVRRFQEDSSIAAFLVSLRAGGTGLNLTGADYVVLFDPWWNPAVETQAIDRAHRIGQTRRVFSYKLITRGTVEEKILRLQERKRSLTDDLIRSQAQWGRSLTLEDVEELFGG